MTPAREDLIDGVVHTINKVLLPPPINTVAPPGVQSIPLCFFNIPLRTARTAFCGVCIRWDPIACWCTIKILYIIIYRIYDIYI